MEKVLYQVRFWGVRGSLPVPGKQTVEFGGNTACVQIQIGQRQFIMDAGTGIFNLGKELIQQKKPIYGEIFITHTHWDHIQGFPFFGPAFVAGNHFTLYGQSNTDLTFADLMKGQMMHEHFPVSLEKMGAIIEFREINDGVRLDLGDGISVTTLENNHPGGSLSYRVDHAGRSCCYVTDTEHVDPIDPKLLNFVKGANLIIYDANFTNQEYAGFNGLAPKIGWGHSTWQEGIKLAKAAGAMKLILFHHANFHTDEDMKMIEQDAQKVYADCFAAREGMVITL